VVFIENKKVRFDYEILEKYSAGIELFGFEVKSIKKHQGSLEGAYVIIRGGEAYLLGANIPPFQPVNTRVDYDPIRTRRLLLTKKEILKMRDEEKTKGLTLVPVLMYNKGTKIKVEVAVAKGKKKFDKREDIKKREVKKQIDRTLKYK